MAAHAAPISAVGQTAPARARAAAAEVLSEASVEAGGIDPGSARSSV